MSQQQQHSSTSVHHILSVATALSLNLLLLSACFHSYTLTTNTNFQLFEILIVFAILFCILQQKSNTQLVLILFATTLAILSHYISQGQFVLTIISSFLFYLALFLHSEHYLMKFALGAAANYFAIVSVQLAGDNSKLQFYALQFILCLSIQAALHDIAGCLVQITYILVAWGKMYMAYFGVQSAVLGYCIVKLAFQTHEAVKRQKEKVRALQSHAVMNAYITTE